MRSSGDRTLEGERILGDGDFVESVLAAGSERLERLSRLMAAGYDSALPNGWPSYSTCRGVGC
jgi:hypothetical protein